jgi:hypothetical protein
MTHRSLGPICVLLLAACSVSPPARDDSAGTTESSTGGVGSETGDGDGDGDGDPGDGDPGSPCNFPLEPCPNDDCGVNGRRHVSDMDCGVEGCSGLWSGTDAWAPMFPANQFGDMPPVDPSAVWDCEPGPDVDRCVEVDTNGHVGCFRFDGEFAVAVWPSCAVAVEFAVEFAVDVGNGMCATASGAGDGDP